MHVKKKKRNKRHSLSVSKFFVYDETVPTTIYRIIASTNSHHPLCRLYFDHMTFKS